MKTTKGKGHFALRRADGKWRAEATMGVFGFEPIDGKFPDDRMVSPADASGEVGQFDPELLVRFSKAGKALTVKPYPTVPHSGTSGARVVFDGCDDFVGVIMPRRNAKPEGHHVTWGKMYPPKPALALAA